MPKSIKILTIGNSFSDNATKYMYPIFKSFGYKNIHIGQLYIGGCSLERHRNNLENDIHDYDYRSDFANHMNSKANCSMLDGILDDSWDYITLQQASCYSGIESTYNDDLDKIYKYVKENAINKNFIFGWHMTWAYQYDSTHPNFPDYDSDQHKMYKMICDCTQNVILKKDYFKFVVPVGTAIQNARTSFIGDHFTTDGFHLDPLGEFIAGVMYYVSITKDLDLDFDTDELPLEFIPYLPLVKEVVRNAFINPYKVIDSNYITPLFDEKHREYKEYIDLAYDKYKETKLDIYTPVNGFSNLIIHFHGGGLNSGDKWEDSIREIAFDCIDLSIAFASVNYRMYPDYKYPDFLNDAAKAVKFIMDWLDKYNGKTNVYISGQSAGAYITMMLAFNTKLLTDVGVNPLDIKGFISESGQPTDHFNVLWNIGDDGRRVKVTEIAPINYVVKELKFTNMLIIAYKDDMKCRLAQNRMLFETINYFENLGNVKFMELYGAHCRSSCFKVQGHYAYARILIDYVNSDK